MHDLKEYLQTAPRKQLLHNARGKLIVGSRHVAIGDFTLIPMVDNLTNLRTPSPSTNVNLFVAYQIGC